MCIKVAAGNFRSLSGDVIELLIYHQPSVKPSLTLRPFGVLGYVAGHSLTVPVILSLVDKEAKKLF